MTKTTISELEAQRAQILQEIEAKAGKISQNASAENSNPSLNDWLNAAEEVMPEPENDVVTLKSMDKTKDSHGEQLKRAPEMKKSNTPFFTLVIVFTLFLTIIGVVFIVYSSLSNEIKDIQAAGSGSEQFNELKASVVSLQESVDKEGVSDANAQTQQQIVQLNDEITLLKEQVADLQKQLQSYANNQAALQSGNSQLLQKSDNAGLESLVQSKLNEIISQLSTTKQPVENTTLAEVPQPSITEPQIAELESVVAPLEPAVPEKPAVMLTEDVRWLMDQADKNYVLQLASMPTEDSLSKIISKHSLANAKIIPQLRNEVTTYVLVTGSFMDKTEAQVLANKIKKQTGISPWIRQVEDLERRVK